MFHKNIEHLDLVVATVCVLGVQRLIDVVDKNQGQK